MELTVKYVAGMVDHTNLHADATKADFVKLADEAKKYGFKSLAINTYPVTLCRELCEGSKVLTGAAVAFPLGQMTIETDRKSTRLNSSHPNPSRMPSSA